MVRRSAIILFLVASFLVGSLPHPAARAVPTTKVTFALNWIKNVEFGGLWMAQKNGWWTQAGLDVSARGYDFTNDPVLLVGAGKYMFGFQDGASLVIARSHGIPVKAIWASGQRSPFAFITMPKSGIKTVKDFKGKRIGYQAHELYVLQTMLNHEGMTLADVKPVVVQFDPTVLVAGKVDAYLAYLTNEPIELKLKYNLDVNIIKASDYGYDFYSDVLFTTDSMIKTQPDLVKKVVSVMHRGWLYAIAHPQEVASYVVPKLDSQDSVKQQTQEMQELAPMASSAGAAVGSMTQPRWENGIGLLLKYKQIKATIPTASVFTTSFLPK